MASINFAELASSFWVYLIRDHEQTWHREVMIERWVQGRPRFIGGNQLIRPHTHQHITLMAP